MDSVIERSFPDENPARMAHLVRLPMTRLANRLLARRCNDSPVELVPANVYTAIGYLASAMALGLGLAWAKLTTDATPALAVVTVAGVLIIAYYARSISRLTRAFYGVKDAVARS